MRYDHSQLSMPDYTIAGIIQRVQYSWDTQHVFFSPDIKPLLIYAFSACIAGLAKSCCLQCLCMELVIFSCNSADTNYMWLHNELWLHLYVSQLGIIWCLNWVARLPQDQCIFFDVCRYSQVNSNFLQVMLPNPYCCEDCCYNSLWTISDRVKLSSQFINPNISVLFRVQLYFDGWTWFSGVLKKKQS